MHPGDAASIALHTMVYLGKHKGKIVSTNKIADKLKISENHLSKVLQRLTKIGMVTPTRGPKGGYSLAKDPKKISFLEIYEAIEGKFIPANCLLNVQICNGKNCILGNLLQKINKQVMDYLKKTKLSRFIDNSISNKTKRRD